MLITEVTGHLNERLCIFFDGFFILHIPLPQIRTKNALGVASHLSSYSILLYHFECSWERHEGSVSRDFNGIARLVDVFTRRAMHRSEERRVGKECRSRWSPYH